MHRSLSIIDSILNQIDSKSQFTMSQFPSSTDECKLQSWVIVSADSHFPIQNIPFGVIELADGSQHIATRIGDFVLDLNQISKLNYFADLPDNGRCFEECKLNAFMSFDRAVWTKTRRIIQYLLSSKSEQNKVSKCLLNINKVRMLMPCHIGDYTDFYSSRNHATNVGIMFRGKENALKPNWLHLPVGYHGRASSVVVSDTPIRRPFGQLKKDINDRTVPPNFGACKRLDIELEVGFLYGGKSNKLGNPIRLSDAYDHIFGMVFSFLFFSFCIAKMRMNE